MKEITLIKAKRNKLLIKKHIPLKKALLLARKKGLSGRLEIHQITHNNLQEYILSLYFINEANKIVGSVFPSQHLNI